MKKSFIQNQTHRTTLNVIKSSKIQNSAIGVKVLLSFYDNNLFSFPLRDSSPLMTHSPLIFVIAGCN